MTSLQAATRAGPMDPATSLLSRPRPFASDLRPFLPSSASIRASTIANGCSRSGAAACGRGCEAGGAQERPLPSNQTPVHHEPHHTHLQHHQLHHHQQQAYPHQAQQLPQAHRRCAAGSSGAPPSFSLGPASKHRTTSPAQLVTLPGPSLPVTEPPHGQLLLRPPAERAGSSAGSAATALGSFSPVPGANAQRASPSSACSMETVPRQRGRISVVAGLRPTPSQRTRTLRGATTLGRRARASTVAAAAASSASTSASSTASARRAPSSRRASSIAEGCTHVKRRHLMNRVLLRQLAQAERKLGEAVSGPGSALAWLEQAWSSDGGAGGMLPGLCMLNILAMLYGSSTVVAKFAEELSDGAPLSLTSSVRFLAAAAIFLPVTVRLLMGTPPSPPALAASPSQSEPESVDTTAKPAIAAPFGTTSLTQGGSGSDDGAISAADAEHESARWTALRGGAELALWSFLSTVLLGAAANNNAKSASILYAFSVFFVPVMELTSGRVPRKTTWVAILAALAGMGLLEVESKGWEGPPVLPSHAADLWAILGSMCAAIQIFRSEALCAASDPLHLTAVQLPALALLGLAWQAYDVASSGMGPGEVLGHLEHLPWAHLLYTGCVCSGLCTWLELNGLQKVHASTAMLVYTTIPLWGALFSFLSRGDTPGLSSLVGGSVIVLASLLAQLLAPAISQTQQQQKQQQGEEMLVPVVHGATLDAGAAGRKDGEGAEGGQEGEGKGGEAGSSSHLAEQMEAALLTSQLKFPFYATQAKQLLAKLKVKLGLVKTVAVKTVSAATPLVPITTSATTGVSTNTPSSTPASTNATSSNSSSNSSNHGHATATAGTPSQHAGAPTGATGQPLPHEHVVSQHGSSLAHAAPGAPHAEGISAVGGFGNSAAALGADPAAAAANLGAGTPAVSPGIPGSDIVHLLSPSAAASAHHMSHAVGAAASASAAAASASASASASGAVQSNPLQTLAEAASRILAALSLGTTGGGATGSSMSATASVPSLSPPSPPSLGPLPLPTPELMGGALVSSASAAGHALEAAAVAVASAITSASSAWASAALDHSSGARQSLTAAAACAAPGPIAKGALAGPRGGGASGGEMGEALPAALGAGAAEGLAPVEEAEGAWRSSGVACTHHHSATPSPVPQLSAAGSAHHANTPVVCPQAGAPPSDVHVHPSAPLDTLQQLQQAPGNLAHFLSKAVEHLPVHPASSHLPLLDHAHHGHTAIHTLSLAASALQM